MLLYVIIPCNWFRRSMHNTCQAKLDNCTTHFHTDFQNQMELIIFLKDIAIAGGFLIIASNEPKICSIDYFLKSKN